MLFRGKQGKNEVEKKDFTWPSYKISCKTNTLWCFWIFFGLYERVNVPLQKNTSNLNCHPSDLTHDVTKVCLNVSDSGVPQSQI